MAATTKATSKVNKTKGMPPRAAKPGSAKLPASSAVKKTTATPKKKAGGLLKGQTKLSLNVSPPVQVPTNPPTPPPRPEVNKFTYAEVAKSPGRGEVPKSIDVEMNSPARSIASVGSLKSPITDEALNGFGDMVVSPPRRGTASGPSPFKEAVSPTDGSVVVEEASSDEDGPFKPHFPPGRTPAELRQRKLAAMQDISDASSKDSLGDKSSVDSGDTMAKIVAEIDKEVKLQKLRPKSPSIKFGSSVKENSSSVPLSKTAGKSSSVDAHEKVQVPKSSKIPANEPSKEKDPKANLQAFHPRIHSPPLVNLLAKPTLL